MTPRMDLAKNPPVVGPQISLSLQEVAASLGRHVALYRHRAPRYQTAMLNSMLALWSGQPARVVDVGGGSGVIGQCIADLLPVGIVESVDVVDRFCTSLSIKTSVYDGCHLPFPDGSFDAATINNVVHHVPVTDRVPLFQEIRRVNTGALYIKDHLAHSRLDHLRLTVLDLIGNVPFGGMVRATYLSEQDWAMLAADSGYKITARTGGTYRSGLFALLFPNRLETSMRWEPV